MSDKVWRTVNDVLHLSTSLPLFPIPFIITVDVPHVWFYFPLQRTCADCVRAFEHIINYLLMLTLEEDAFFVLAHTARVSVVFTSPSRCRGNRQNLTVRVGRVRFRNPWTSCETKQNRNRFSAVTDALTRCVWHDDTVYVLKCRYSVHHNRKTQVKCCATLLNTRAKWTHQHDQYYMDISLSHTGLSNCTGSQTFFMPLTPVWGDFVPGSPVWFCVKMFYYRVWNQWPSQVCHCVTYM